MKHPVHPPKLATRLLKGFLRPELVEEVTGDLKEGFDDDVRKLSPTKARLRYWLEVINYLRPFAIRNFTVRNQNPLPMLRSDLKTSWRNLTKRKSFSLINIGGLAIGIASFFFLLAYVDFHRSYENFHINAPNIYRVTLDLYRGDEYLMTDCEMYAPVGPTLKARVPEVVDYVRMMNVDDRHVIVGDKHFLDEQSYFADPVALKFFTYEPLFGSLDNALTKPFEAVLTRSTANRYFGETDARNKVFEVAGRDFHVVAVIEDLPFNTHLKFNALLSHASYPPLTQNWYSDENWNSGNNEYLYLLMQPGTDLKAFNEKLKQFSVEFKDKMGDDRCVAERMEDIHLYSHKTFEPDTNANANVVNAMLVIAFFILGLAWVNYINLSTAKSLERAREVGVRKVMGSSYSQLMSQFLTESFLINVAAATLALGIIRLSLPLFQWLSGIPSLSFFDSTTFWYLTGFVVLVGVFCSGLYPAFVLSAFQPVSVLKGRFKNSSHGRWLRKTLVIFQFSATAVLMICLTTIFYQLKFLKTFDLGMNINQALVLTAPETDSLYAKRFATFRNKILAHPGVHKVAQSQSIPGANRNEISTSQSIYRMGADRSSGSFNYYHYGIDENFLDTYQMKLLAGSNFKPDDRGRDVVLINEEARKSLGFASNEEAIGSRITYNTVDKIEGSAVVGVIRDFNQWSPKEAKLPMIFAYTRYPGYITLNIDATQAKSIIEYADDEWRAIFGSDPFNYFFLDDRYHEQYRIEEQFGNVLAVFAVIAIVIASLGLFGLSAHAALQRTKEVGIRKALGGTSLDIVRLLSKDFVTLVIIAAIIAIPLAYVLSSVFLESYASRITIGPELFLIPVAGVFVVAVLTISAETLKAARTNPVDALRTE